MSHDDEYVPISRSNLDALMNLLGDHDHVERVREAAHREGKADAPRAGYQAGRDLGHDTGLSARQDTRGYVHGILDGWAAGCEERHRIAEQLLRETRPRPQSQASEQWMRRPAEREAEPEREAG